MNDTETGEPLFSELPWMIVYISEGLLILAGNSIAVFIFMKIRNNLRRTSYLLINLTIADLLLSVAISLYLWEESFCLFFNYLLFNDLREAGDCGEVLLSIATAPSIVPVLVT